MILATMNRNNPHVEGWLRPTTDRLCDGDYVALIMTHQEGFVFDQERAKTLSGKRFVCFEYGEYGQQESWKNDYLPGITIHSHRATCDLAERLKLDEFLRQQNIVLTFKREFSANCQELVNSGKIPYAVEPVEIFFDNLPPIPPLDQEDYMSRVGLIFHLFGNSHHDRKRLAAALMERQERICTSVGKMTDLINARLPFSLVEQIEHISRYPVGDAVHWQSKCLLSCNLGGFGQKAFRLREAFHSAVPVMADIGMKYAIQPSDDNAVMLPAKEGKLLIPESMDKLEAVLRDRENLWNRMQNAHHVAHALQPEPYVRDQLNSKIQKYL